MDIQTIDHLEYYVADAEQTARELRDSFGFTMHGQGDPDTGLAGCRSILLRQHEITLLVTSSVGAHRADEYVRRHGDGVAVVGLGVPDAAAAFAEAVERGALPVEPPMTLDGPGGRVTFASVQGFGDVAHRFTSRERPDGQFAPGVIAEHGAGLRGTGLLRTIDHLAICVPAGTLRPTVEAYREIFGLPKMFEERIIVGAQAMESEVVQSQSRGVTFTIIEPDTSRAPGQIDRFIANHDGAGVQHVAFLTEDIAAGVRDCTDRGVGFLATPETYYDDLPGRLGSVGVPLETLRELSILADRDYAGVMLQIFTESVHPRRTLFYELIERRGARTFGTGNIKALYEAVERQQVADQAARR
ncbi:4-hydroxyphenylpyruvate dioxygenase [Luedemannella flava]|uniref:4-hydroxyphenylpyruvate dioxygenase n=1 Tax=Luedemannella flava TaxID=349316 RepID=A0ABN2LFR7_9ACTN